VIATLARDNNNLLARSGKDLVAAAVGREPGIQDIDGSSPRPLSLDEA